MQSDAGRGAVLPAQAHAPNGHGVLGARVTASGSARPFSLSENRGWRRRPWRTDRRSRGMALRLNRRWQMARQGRERLGLTIRRIGTVTHDKRRPRGWHCSTVQPARGGHPDGRNGAHRQALVGHRACRRWRTPFTMRWKGATWSLMHMERSGRGRRGRTFDRPLRT